MLKNPYIKDWEENRSDEIKALTSKGIIPVRVGGFFFFVFFFLFFFLFLFFERNYFFFCYLFSQILSRTIWIKKLKTERWMLRLWPLFVLFSWARFFFFFFFFSFSFLFFSF